MALFVSTWGLPGPQAQSSYGTPRPGERRSGHDGSPRQRGGDLCALCLHIDRSRGRGSYGPGRRSRVQAAVVVIAKASHRFEVQALPV
jgi:hypothetical protein